MKIIIEIDVSETEMKTAIAKGWNERFNEDLTCEDIKEVSNKEDILGAIPYLSLDKITIP